MASLTDLFNPTFFMFLGILVLVVALLVVYFETKFRDQNHKIASMLSLVSSLAEEVNGTKMIIHQLTMNQIPQMQHTQNFHQNKETTLEEIIQIKENNDLIAVSDDDDSDSEYDSDSEGEDDSDSEGEDDSEGDSEGEESVHEKHDFDDEISVSVIEIGEPNPDIKIFKLNIIKNDEDSESENDINQIDGLSIASLDELDDLDDLDDNSSTSSESIKGDKKTNNFIDLKSINITLEETKSEQSIDYKKMALPKLRSVISEKGLSKDSSKLKKNELLKLLGVE
jgi:hypothetical protein